MSMYWMVWSLETWPSKFKKVLAHWVRFSFRIASRVAASAASSGLMKLKSSWEIICDLIQSSHLKPTAVDKVLILNSKNIHKEENTYCMYDCQLICWARISVACCCNLLVAASMSEKIRASCNTKKSDKHKSSDSQFPYCSKMVSWRPKSLYKISWDCQRGA